MTETNCPKCGSSEYSLHLGASLILRNSRTKRPEHRIECDHCGFEWKWVE